MIDPPLEAAVILAVDDEPANLRLLEKLLVSAGYAPPRCVSDARQVSTAYQARRPDLILLDINMPHVDGFAVLRQLRALNDPLMPPVIVLTARDDPATLMECLSHGVRDFLVKPFERTEFLMRVRNLLDVQMGQCLLQAQRITLERMVAQRTLELHASRLEVTERLGRAAGFRDNDTGAHVIRMSRVAALVARALGWDDQQCDDLLHASPMHDIGKIGIPDHILRKPGPLSPAEWEEMKTHTLIGARILADAGCPLLVMAEQIALSHHERWDGTGYPQGLQGTAIPLAARIVAVADVFDALLSERPYKRAWPLQDALDHLQAQSGRHFDPVVLEAFMRSLEPILAVHALYADAVASAA